MAKDGKKIKFNPKTLIIGLLLLGLIGFYAGSLGKRTNKIKDSADKETIQELAEYDMNKKYPVTVGDVLKLHNRYMEAYYSLDIDDDDLTDMNKNVRHLYSAELLSYNSENDMLISLKKDIEVKKSEDYVMKGYDMPSASDIAFYTQDGKELATAIVKQTWSLDGEVGYLPVQYVLIKENGQWKIYAWGNTADNDKTEE